MSKLVVLKKDELSLPPVVEKALKKHREQLLKAQLYEEELREAIYEAMDAHGIKTWTNEMFTATLRDPSTRKSFDTTRFKKEHPDMYDEYIKVSPVKGGLRLEYHD